jgi:hypothetical protein
VGLLKLNVGLQKLIWIFLQEYITQYNVISKERLN